MNRYSISASYRKLLSFCFKFTFIIIGAYLFFFLAVVLSVVQGWINQNDSVLISVAYVAGSLLSICIFIFSTYAISYIWELWKSGYRKKALAGLVVFIFLNILTGYIWYFRSEIKRQEIEFKLV
jgi:ABC-type transport system involved in multi-copper enzyme maturation permease subunit